MARQPRWSETDEIFIIDNYNKMLVSDIAKYLNRPIGYIYSCASELGLKKHKKEKKHALYKRIMIKSRRGLKYISGTHFNRIKYAAIKYRNLEFNLTIEYVENLFIQQKFKCALTNLDLTSGYKKISEITASLDRIDPLKGYIEGNVQWVHKDINQMKWDYTQEKFINYCKLVAKHNEH